MIPHHTPTRRTMERGGRKERGENEGRGREEGKGKGERQREEKC